MQLRLGPEFAAFCAEQAGAGGSGCGPRSGVATSFSPTGGESAPQAAARRRTMSLRYAAALPLGANCHLGMALTRLGHHETSLFRWADVSRDRVQAFLERPDAPIFAGETRFRFVGTTLGTLDHAMMRARLGEVPPGARVNTIVYDADGASYVHGVQLGLAEAEALSYAAISAANALKIAHLQHKFVSEWRREAPIAIRLEWAPVADPAPFLALGAALRAGNEQARLYVVAPVGGVTGEREGTRFVALNAPLPPGGDVMNVTATAAEFASLFASWGLKPYGVEKHYIFDI